ncbi:neurabin-1-like [Nerophis lumbriciformis]|uniref:neurabin-1-like n=1 Tax=Nerophis lumbriciformis TaxID=546530 RepID=UPI002AE083D5|nr:neurabin-2-like [Nerophis lumbriciformis]
MMRTDHKGRSASPHRITYETDFHAIKCSFDSGTSLKHGSKAAPAQCSDLRQSALPTSFSDPLVCGRPRTHSSRGTKIRDNIFLQMDSQQSKQDGGSVQCSSGSTTALLSPQSPSLQLQTSPFSACRRPVMGSVSSISTPEAFLQDKAARSEEMRDIDRAALAQKFSVTRKLFETKVFTGAAPAQVSRCSLSKEKESLVQDKLTINMCIPTTDPKSLTSDLLGGSPPCVGSKSQREEEAKEVIVEPCLNPEEPLRAELVHVKSSDSDESEEKEKEWVAFKSDELMGANVEELVDEVFEEPSVETVGLNAGDCPEMADKYEQVSEQCRETEREELSQHADEPREELSEMGEVQSQGSTKAGKATPELQECANMEQKVLGEDDVGKVEGGREVKCHVTSPLQGVDTSLLSLEYEEIPGIPQLPDDDDGDAAETSSPKVRFSSAPIKVYNTYSNADYHRHNEDIDPVSASAEYELEKRVDKMDVFEVEIKKGDDGLGISIIGMGVGADQGLEKLGIFVKTVTEGGQTHKDGRIQVNDQIVEVDGVSLVGVSQLFASTVLKNTSGLVKFLIGRDKEGVESEVARLVNESLELEKATQKEKNATSKESESDDCVSEEEDEDEENTLLLSCSDGDQVCLKYRKLGSRRRSRAAQLQHAREKLKAYEEQQASWESQKAELEQKVEDAEEKADKLEKYWQEAQTLCRLVSQRLADAQSQSDGLEVKYCKAKRLLRDYQSREEEAQRREADLCQELEEHRETIGRLQAQLEGKEPQSGGQSLASDPDWHVAVPGTQRLDCSAHIARGQLAQKSRRHPPSRDKLRESLKKEDGGQESPSQAEVPSQDVTPTIYVTDTSSPPHTKSSSSRKSKRKIPDFSGLRKSLGKMKTQNGRTRASCGHLAQVPSQVSPSGSASSMPSCLPFTWFGERGREKEEEGERGVGWKLRSMSSSSLPYLTTSGRGDQSVGFSWKGRGSNHWKGRGSNHWEGCGSNHWEGRGSNHSLSGHSLTFTLSSSETLDQVEEDQPWQSGAVSEWSSHHVSLWLAAANMEACVAHLSAAGVDGTQLLAMDKDKLKALGVSQSERCALKKKLKELKKRDEKEEKVRRKERAKKEKACLMMDNMKRPHTDTLPRTESLL